MDSKGRDDMGGIKTPKETESEDRTLNSKVAGMGSISSKDMIFRADKIDLKNLDMQLEKHLSRVWSRNVENQKPKEEWEIDLSKLDIRYVVAHGTYGTVFRGAYDNQDVAGKHPFIFHLFSFSFTSALIAEVKQFIGNWLLK